MRRKRLSSEQPELGPAPAAQASAEPAPPPPAPAVMEYQAVDQAWRVSRWEVMTAELGVAADQLPDFHAWASKFPRAWTLVRRLFGVMPVSVPLGGDPDDYRVWSPNELASAFGLDGRAFQAELEAVRSGWGKRVEGRVSSVERTAPGTRPSTLDARPALACPQPALLVTDEEFLREFGFPEALFETGEVQERQADRAWFCLRARDWERLLRDRNASRLAVQVLIKDLRLRRANIQLCRLEAKAFGDVDQERKRGTQVRDLNATIRDLESSYQEQLEALQELAPWFNVTGRQVTVTGAIGELIAAVQEYEARGDSRLMDGIFTALEIQVLMRSSQQIPEPQYRAGWVTYVNESRQFLWEPNARSQFKQTDLARLDHAWKAAAQKFNEESGTPLPDLESDGPEGEYAELVERVQGPVISNQ